MEIEKFTIPEDKEPIAYGARALRQEINNYLQTTIPKVGSFPHFHWPESSFEHFIPATLERSEESKAKGKYDIIALFESGTIKATSASIVKDDDGFIPIKITALAECFRPALDKEVIEHAPALVNHLIVYFASDAQMAAFGSLYKGSVQKVQDTIDTLKNRHAILDRIYGISKTSLEKANNKDINLEKMSKETEEYIDFVVQFQTDALALYKERPQIISHIAEVAKTGDVAQVKNEMDAVINKLLKFYFKNNEKYKNLDGQAVILRPNAFLQRYSGNTKFINASHDNANQLAIAITKEKKNNRNSSYSQKSG